MYKNLHFNTVLAEYQYSLHLGDIVAGCIFAEEKKGFLVDVGSKHLAYLPKNEVSINKYKLTKPHINYTREFFLLGYNKKSTQLIISIKRLEYIRAWQRIKQIKQEDIILELHIHKINKGGLLTYIEGLKGFIPNSHIIDRKIKHTFLNQKIPCQFLALHNQTNQILFSHRRALLQQSSKFLYIGQITLGKIKKITKYGIFVEIRDFLALLHISELEKTIDNGLSLFEINQIIKVQIIHIDTKQGRISVSRRNIH
uniref:Ribosomal protein S1 n=1 Tax=Neogoniolithon spectabile TaxID=231755 RepID=A0A3G3MGM3_9FLOR|nr:ribosomal protein S1 [Neogoniolithon spectabile]AYR05984.1 ribosomal protein S1 [Neogoniolithon spectabile]